MLPERSPTSVSGWDRSSQWQACTQLGQALGKALVVETLQIFLRICKRVFFWKDRFAVLHGWDAA